MKKITLITAIAMIAFTSNSFAQAEATGTSTTTVIAPITITADQPLAFGNVTEDGTGGTIEVTAESGTATTTNTGGAQAVDGAVSAGSFDVTGESGNAYSITLPDDGTITLGGEIAESPAIAVDGFNSNIAEGAIGTEGTETFYVGAIITLAAGQDSDTYTGTYPVTVQYL